jgi:hypothetical protein
MRNSEETKYKITHIMIYSILVGLLLESFSMILSKASFAPESQLLIDILRQLGAGVLAAGAVGIVFDFLASRSLLWGATSRLSEDFEAASQKQKTLLDNLESRVDRIGEEIVMTSGMLKNATSVGIQAVYNGRETPWHEEVAKSIRNSADRIRIAGISLADLCGYWGGKSLPHEAMEAAMSGKDGVHIQILFADPEGEGLRTRAKFEHPGMPYEDTRAYKQTVAKIAETLEIAKKAMKHDKVEVRLYGDTPTCFLIITDAMAFIEQYTYSGRGGSNVVLGVKSNTPLYRMHEDHFEALWKDARPATDYCKGHDRLTSQSEKLERNDDTFEKAAPADAARSSP